MSDPTVELWGFFESDVEKARAATERALSIRMDLHESESIGPYYHASLCASHADLTLRPNLDAAFDPDTDDPDECLEEPDFPDYGVLLYVEWHVPGHTCRNALAALGGDAQLLLVE